MRGNGLIREEVDVRMLGKRGPKRLRIEMLDTLFEKNKNGAMNKGPKIGRLGEVRHQGPAEY